MRIRPLDKPTDSRSIAVVDAGAIENHMIYALADNNVKITKLLKSTFSMTILLTKLDVLSGWKFDKI